MAKLRWKERDLGGYLNGKITLELGKVTNSISVAKLHWKGLDLGGEITLER